MKVLKTALAASTALGLGLIPAFAGGANEAYLSQDGDGNTATVQQSAGPGANRVGTVLDPILQRGDNNKFSEIQATGGGFSRGGNVVEAMKQIGDRNSFQSYYSNNAGANEIRDAAQIGDGNVASVSRNASVGGSVGVVLQEGDSNYLSIGQTGQGNIVESATMLGDRNGGSVQNASDYGTLIRQNGDGNRIQRSYVEGSDNNAVARASGVFNDNVHRIEQYGNFNGWLGSSAVTFGSDGNYIHVLQNGDGNNFDLSQGVDTDSTRNGIALTQMGRDNMARVREAGSYNEVAITQLGAFNHGTIDIMGNWNGAQTAFSGGAPMGLESGTLYQDGDGNEASLIVTGDANAFAFKQLGDGNAIRGTQSGDGNQMAVLQNGNFNTATIDQ